MEKAEYPSRTCREPVWNQHGMSYGCEMVDLHPGPCASLSVQSSVASRDRWEADNPEWRKNVGQMEDLA